MFRSPTPLEALELGEPGLWVICDACWKPVDYVPKGGPWAALMAEGKLYATPRSHLCWRCVERAGMKVVG